MQKIRYNNRIISNNKENYEYIENSIINFSTLSNNDRDHFLFVISDGSYFSDINKLRTGLKIDLFNCIISHNKINPSLQLLEILFNDLAFTIKLGMITNSNQEEKIISIINSNEKIFIQSKSRLSFLLHFAKLSQNICDFVQNKFEKYYLNENNCYSTASKHYRNIFPITLFFDLCKENKFANKKKVFLFLFKNERLFAEKHFLPKFPELNKYKVLL